MIECAASHPACAIGFTRCFHRASSAVCDRPMCRVAYVRFVVIFGRVWFVTVEYSEGGFFFSEHRTTTHEGEGHVRTEL